MDPAHFQDVLAKSKDLWHLLALQSVVIIWYVCQPSSDSQTSLVVKNTAELIERAIERGARDYALLGKDHWNNASGDFDIAEHGDAID